MNGIKVMFGVIGNMRLVFLLFVISVFISSCIGKSSSTCEWEKKNFKERWDFVVEKIYKHPQYKSTFVIETTNNKRIFFRPIQDLVAFSEKGDRIVKEPYSKYAYRVTSDGDSIRSRIYSTSCDSIVERQNYK